MKNLVSRNPVLRFKLGRKIIKAGEGLDLDEPYISRGNKLKSWLKDTFSDWNIYTGIAGNNSKNSLLVTKVNTSPDNKKINSTTSSSGKGLEDTAKAIANGNKGPKSTIKQQNLANAKVKTSKRSNNTYPQTTFMGIKRGGNVTNFNDAINADLRAKLIASGSFTNADFANTESFQNALNRYFGKDNYGSVVADGMWGNQTQRAFDEAMKKINAPVVNTAEGIKFLGEKPRLISGIDIATKIVPKLNIPKLAPSLGYNTTNTYEDKDFYDKVSGLGIRSNDDLARFMKDTSGNNVYWNENESWKRQFRNDINQALGGDYSDANIRKVFGTQGRWGRRGFLGRGDFGDFQNALQVNAGTWNGIYDNKLQNLVKNIDWSKFKYYKQGGNLLPSRNIVKRFKSFRKEAL